MKDRKLYIDQSLNSSGIAFRTGQIIYYEDIIAEPKKEYYYSILKKEIKIPKTNLKQFISKIVKNENNEDFKILIDKNNKKIYSFNRIEKDKIIFNEVKQKHKKLEITTQEKVFNLLSRLNDLHERFDFTEVIYEKAGSIPKKYNQSTKKWESVANTQTNLKLGAILGAIYIFSSINELPLSEVRAQSHQSWVRNEMERIGIPLNISEYKKPNGTIGVKNLTKKDSIAYATQVIIDTNKSVEFEKISEDTADAISMLKYDESKEQV